MQRLPHPGSDPTSSSLPNANVLEKLAGLEQAIDSTSRDNRRLTLSVRELIASNKQLRQQLSAQQDTIRTQSQQLDATKRDLRQTRAQLKLAKSVSSATTVKSTAGASEGVKGGSTTDQVLRLRAQLASATTQVAQMQLLVHDLESDLGQARSQLANARDEHDRQLREHQLLIQLLVSVMSGCERLPPFPTSCHILSSTILAAIARCLALSNTPCDDPTWRSALTQALTLSCQTIQTCDDSSFMLSPTALISLSTALLTKLPSFNTQGATESIDTLLLICTNLPTPPLDHTSTKLLFHTLIHLLAPCHTALDSSSPIREKAACAVLALLDNPCASPVASLLPPDFDAIASLVLADLVDHGILYKVSPTTSRGALAAVPGLVPVLDSEYSLMPVHACLAVVLKVVADQAREECAWVFVKTRVQVRALVGLIDEVADMGEGDDNDNVEQKLVGGLREQVGLVWNAIESWSVND
ncbi:hypothetical protein BCR44DRAFT_60038 [Catenaria anguillulae PL171]|uniref:Uncharacterized protein n=1 Tax=Catenaria anguillulae PL171 TaxID=765915 RepID=A0A1Y2HWI4_9FUNG|nr:hypothetical protein BCR44DRAFT_60038 [Catenaria anguillulae PL171]